MSKTGLLVLINILLLTVFSYGQVSQSQTNAPTGVEWSKFESKDCKFSALFPTKPLENDIKDQVVTHVFVSNVGTDRYIIKCAKYQNDLQDPLLIQQELDSIRSQVVASIGGKFLEERRMTFSGFRGREVKIEAGGFYVTVRLLWAKPWLYQLFTQIPISANRAEEKQKFFDSFALDGHPKSVATLADNDTTDEPPKLSEGIIKGKAIKLVTPAYPMGERGNITIQVHIVIDERGRVISATTDSGNSAFSRAAVEAAKASIFAPTLFGGVAVKVQGVLTYNFSRR